MPARESKDRLGKGGTLFPELQLWEDILREWAGKGEVRRQTGFGGFVSFMVS